MNPTAPDRGAVAALADLAARVVNSATQAGTDSTGQNMVRLRAEMVGALQRALRDVYPDARDHNRTLSEALQRRLAG